MVVNSYRPLWSILRELWVYLLPVIAYELAISWLDIRYHLETFNFPVPILAILGTVIGLVLAFRTNSSYARWWEARTLWGAIVNDSRSWVRQLLEFVQSPDDSADTGVVLHQMAYRQIAWCYALSRFLRGDDPTEDLDSFLPAEEIESYRSFRQIPNQMLIRQAEELRKLREAGKLELYSWVELERTLTRLTNSMGGCERIRNTPFPASYGRMANGMVYLFVLFLPFGLFDMPSIPFIVTALSLSCAFLVIDRVSIFLQDPFSKRPSDTPMLALSRTIEINIKQMLGETDVPDSLQPVKGVLF